jgi:hypothetical protein
MTGEKDASLIFAFYGTPESSKQMQDKINSMGLITRELKFFEVTPIPLNEDYDTVINEFKHFINCDYWAQRNPLLKNNFFVKQIKGIIEKEVGYKLVEIKEGQWKRDTANYLSSANICPLFVQSNNSEELKGIEKTNLEKLQKFESLGYVNKEDMLSNAEEKEINDDGESHYV